ncbi:WEB family protein, chloroplastic-like protein [Cinnamomum micranthum f. kanehirae]|uniref:WEB family protein, chloroplastic-like protein n=1 Tax=Cinnamomum micranthum f. kanehirae TaxID=337451 RepID=A0A443PRI9_9MAGN|nr:WEB family protein, chloroplastic-like protein [Cinnamomum micranthum f. kanehirae]
MKRYGRCQIPATEAALRHLWFCPRRRLRLRNDVAVAGKRSVQETPSLRWKINGRDLFAERRSRRKGMNGGYLPVSARKIASALWRLRLPAAPSVHIVGHGGSPYLCYPIIKEFDPKTVYQLCDPLPVPQLKNFVLCEVVPSVKFSNFAMEKATKWDPAFPSSPGNVLHFHDHIKLHEDQQLITIMVISALQAELKQSRDRICELETQCHSSRKKLGHFLRKLAAERTSWRIQEHTRMHAVINVVKDELNRERKNCQRMEFINFKLVSELAEAKESAKQFLQDYEKERKTRELIVEVCDELKKEIREEKAEVEDLKSESMKILEEVEEERRMLQMAEVWREERVQMKLIDAKLTLEAKYSQLRKLVADLDVFLGSRSITANVVDKKEAESLREAACSVKIDNIKEFSYQPSTSKDIFFAFEDLRSKEENESKMEPCYNDITSPGLEINTLNCKLNGLYQNQVQRHTNSTADRNRDREDGSVRERISNGENQGVSHSHEGSDQYINRHCQESNVSESGTDWEENTDDDMLNIEITEFCAASGSYSRTKESSISGLQRPYPSYSGNNKTDSVDTSTGIAFEEVSGKGGLCTPSSGHWGSLNLENSQVTLSTKGVEEYTKGIKKTSLMAKLLEERLENQKLHPHRGLE